MFFCVLRPWFLINFLEHDFFFFSQGIHLLRLEKNSAWKNSPARPGLKKNRLRKTKRPKTCLLCVLLSEKNIFDKNKVYGRTTITNVHPKRPWKFFSDKYYRRKLHFCYSSLIRDSAVHVHSIETSLQIKFICHVCTYIHMVHTWMPGFRDDH